VLYPYLDTNWQEVTSLGYVLGSRKGRTPLLDNVDTTGVGLEDKSQKTNHCQTSMLDLLQLLLFKFFRSVVQTKRVPSELSPALRVSGLVVGSVFTNDLDATEFQSGHKGKDLEQRSGGSRRNSLQRIGGGEGIGSSPFVTGKSSETRNNETKDGNHADTAVHKLGLTVPGKSIDGGISGKQLVEVRSNAIGLGGKKARVESNVTNEGSVKEIGSRFTGDGNGRNSSALRKV